MRTVMREIEKLGKWHHVTVMYVTVMPYELHTYTYVRRSVEEIGGEQKLGSRVLALLAQPYK